LETSSGNRNIQRTKRFARDIKKLSRPIQEEAFGIAQQLAQDIFDRDLNIRSMTGFKGVYRVVVMHDYRMIFSFDQKNLYLLRIGHRREIYRKLEL
jgi:mRNA-degrading endonuclease RelE of RelBE toxin-antitoxin system